MTDELARGAAVVPWQIKRCNACGEVKPLSAFYWKSEKGGERQPFCSDPCAKDRNARNYRANAEAVIAAVRRREQVRIPQIPGGCGCCWPPPGAPPAAGRAAKPS